MGYPASLTLITVTGKFDRKTGEPSGTVTFAAPPKVWLRSTSDDTFIPPFSETVQLDSNGEFTVDLPATNDPEWLPANWSYSVTIKVDGSTLTGSLSLPYDGGPVALADVLSGASASAGQTYVLRDSLGEPNGPAALDGDGLLELDQFPDGMNIPSVKDFGAVGDGVADDTTAVQAAVTAAGTTGTVRFTAGTYKISSTLALVSNVQSSPDAILSYTGADTAVRIGSNVSGATVNRKKIVLPQIVQSTKPVTGWTSSGTVGLEVQNANRCHIEITRISGFEVGFLLYGKGQGTAYCNFFMGHLDNNKINQKFDADSGGWTNQNVFYGGSWSHNSNEGLNVSGTKHIHIVNITPNSDANNNTWINASLESPGTVEWTIDAEAGAYNVWLNPRLEFVGGNSKIRWGAGAVRNWIFGGNQIDAVVETHVVGSFGNSIFGTTGARLHPVLSSGIVVENGGSSSNAAITVMRTGGLHAGDAPSTAYVVRLTANGWRGKRYTDAADRIIIDNINGRIQLGDGTVAPTLQISSGSGSPESVVTAPVGSLYLRTNGGANTTLYIKESGTGNTGWIAK